MENGEIMEMIFVLCLIVVLIIFFVIKHYIWDIPHEEIKRLNQVINQIKYSFEKEIKEDQQKYNKEISKINMEKDALQKRLEDSIFISEIAKSNLRTIPYMAAIMAEFETYGLEKLARKLDWGYSQERLKKVKHIREIKRDAEAMVAKNKESYYQLEYLLNMFPNLRDVIDVEYNTLPVIEVSELSDYDATKDFLSREEYESLSVCARNQLALDRYRNSHKRSKWQIGRDYELYVGYKYSLKGYDVDYFGSYMGIEDLGRDIIAKKDDKVLIVQCKYWSSKKQIHENHINQLFGTMMCYCIENSVEQSKVKGILVTNIELSVKAKQMANMLNIEFVENFELGEYPCIKCNINRDEYGFETKIYHLPFDQQYDATKIDRKGEFMATTVAEAEDAGF